MEESTANMFVKVAIKPVGLDPAAYRAHGLRAGFITYANVLGIADQSIAWRTRHRSLASF